MKSIEYWTPLVYLLEGSSLIDALPYIDDYSAEQESTAKKLIQAELSSMEPRNYLSRYDDPSFTLEEANFEVFDLKIKSPASEYEHLSACVHNQAIIEYLDCQKLNLQLLNDFSEESWTKHIRNLEAYEKKLDSDIQRLETANLDLNKSRKLSQDQSKAELLALKQEFLSLLKKNSLIHSKLKEKQEELSLLKSQSDSL